jgi:hypothetical protein
MNLILQTQNPTNPERQAQGALAELIMHTGTASYA